MTPRPDPRLRADAVPAPATHRVRAEIPSPGTLRKILSRERARTDRTGIEFSLVVVEILPGGPSDPGDLERFAEILSRRVRATDVVGTFGDRSLGIVLPATPAEGAGKFVDGIRTLLVNGGRAPAYTIYTYPSPWDFDGKPHGEPPRGRADGTESASSTASRGTTADPSVDGPVRRMEGLLGRPLPLWKRAIDVSVASLCLLLLFPLFLLVAAVIRIVSPGPVLFRQDRVGHRGKPFTMWKFRTMHMDSGDNVHRQYLWKLIREDQPMAKLDSGLDARIIPFGKILRQTCLDELPQMLNVLKGDMTLVGPRPCLPYEAAEYLPWHTRRFDSTPGLTGLWQVSGKNRTTFQEMVRFDIAYARTISPWMDLKIMAKTIPAILEQVADPFRATGPVAPDASDAGRNFGERPE